MRQLKKLSIALLLSSLLTGCSIGVNVDLAYKAQDDAVALSQKAMTYYWEGGDLKKAEKEFFKGITLKGRYDLVANLFLKAKELNPDYLPYSYSLASSYILLNKVDLALDEYDYILKKDPNAFNAHMLRSGYLLALNDKDGFSRAIEGGLEVDRDRALAFAQRFERTENILSTKLNTKAFKNDIENNVIVVLGYALGKDGVMDQVLIERLNQALEQHKLNKKQHIIVTGGVQQGGVTESYLMKNYLVKHGVNANLIHMEDKAKDTVGNAYYSMQILKDLNAQNITLISSASHMRRAIAVFKEMSVTEDYQIGNISNLVYLDFKDEQEASLISDKERLVIYRDMMRAANIFAYPGIQR